MKRHVMLLAVLGILGFGGAGCGPGEEPRETPSGETTEQVPGEETSSEENNVEQFARNCKTTCSGITASGGTCGVVGFGSTTFLGGCKKACRFARQDADAKAASYGCQLTQCSDACG
ncbi:hypothetical protein FJV41_06545 [Myxococcus llanfairpwllgwyngyllgogerychwyrndrobwllllantysiliogogogochensis]|uniref:Lipoprotein n=1 Tax=Myxococcus llanfairpwllgwyngyllgogerychwyrndrobwllllantysiliogogogochensis TaxID=2590453 RepID=A0A540X6D9_9BACT|nr:hypothetical protein [Myxococcus llanfairpwllgwyngyllgogerychwyrndrobwllllantysiliogogogochensis]TQF16808.1 hypothetical protein FJV41_06545 [Myxococcus llanfairpwllgwyngyllgogerychwyrndrobwllllantysiliogogogochensis]